MSQLGLITPALLGAIGLTYFLVGLVSFVRRMPSVSIPSVLMIGVGFGFAFAPLLKPRFSHADLFAWSIVRMPYDLFRFVSVRGESMT